MSESTLEKSKVRIASGSPQKNMYPQKTLRLIVAIESSRVAAKSYRVGVRCQPNCDRVKGKQKSATNTFVEKDDPQNSWGHDEEKQVIG